MVMSEKMGELIGKGIAILKGAGAREVYLFGSTASGQAREDSDLDFAISGLPPERFFRTVGEMDEAMKCQFDVIDLDESTPFVQFLKKEGELKRIG